MKKNKILLLVIMMAASVMLGCEKPKELKSIQSLAVTGTIFDIRIPQVDGKGKELGNPLGKSITQFAHNFDLNELNQNDQQFFSRYATQLISKIQEELSIRVITLEQLEYNFYFQTLPEIRDPTYEHRPEPFRYIDLTDKERISKLCDSFQVDGLLQFYSQFKRQEINSVLKRIFTAGKQGKAEKLILVTHLYLVKKDGTIVLDRTITMKTPNSVQQLNRRVGDFFSINRNNMELFKNLTHSFLTHLIALMDRYHS